MRSGTRVVMVVVGLGALLGSAARCGSSSSEASAAGMGGQGGAGASGSGMSGTSGASGAGAGGEATAGQGGSGPAGSGGAAVAAAYELVPLSGARITSDSAQPNFQHVSAPIDLRDGPFASVKIEVSLATTCFPFETWKTNPPPPGQNFPADCDAFDRNFETILDEPVQDGDPPGLEVIRAITPFGGPLTVSADLTDLANLRPGAHTVHVRIPTWSDGEGKVSGSNGGWNVTVRVKAVPGTPPRKVLAVRPLLNLSLTADQAPAPVALEVPAGTTSARLEYRATGHGGGAVGGNCIGPAEEFCKRTHTLTLDDQTLGKSMLWRTDCADLCTITHYGPADGGFDYCAENPTGAIQSVQAPRANWCPGSETPPWVLTEPALSAPGAHTLTYAISKLLEGGSWRLSAVYYAYGD